MPRVPTCPTHGLGTLSGRLCPVLAGEAEGELKRGGNVSPVSLCLKKGPATRKPGICLWNFSGVKRGVARPPTSRSRHMATPKGPLTPVP